MIRFRDEGRIIKNGFNFYKLSDEHSAGFIFKIGNSAFWCRYSKSAKRWFLQFNKTSEKEYRNMYNE